MEWSNEKVLEFLELFEMEPSLWDPKSKLRKNRVAQNDAWRRITQSLSFEVPLDVLKAKKESLMGRYRYHLNKYKKSMKSGVGTEDVNKTNWFAFDVMDNFLRPVYVSKSNIKPESTSEENSAEETSFFNESIENKSVSENLSPEGCSSNNKCTPSSVHSTVEISEQPYIQHEKTVPEVIKKEKELDEYDHFAGLIASKIRNIENIDDREELMISIHNLTFQFYMKNKNKKSTALTAK